MSQTTKALNPGLALASLIATGSAIAVGWSTMMTSLNSFIMFSPFTVGAYYIGRGIRRKNDIGIEDYKAACLMAWDAFKNSHGEVTPLMIAPVMEQAEAMGGRGKVSVPQFDVSPMLTHSAAIVAPTNTGKSFFLSLVMVERERLFPKSKFTICSIDTWKRGHTWMGLGECPEWIQKCFICLGHKYENTHGFTESIHLETIDEINALYELMERRAKATRDGGPNGKVDLSLETLIIDEFPQFMEYLNDYPKGDDVRNRLKKLLVRGQGYGCVLWVISQDDAVNMLGFHKSEKKQLFICSLYKKDQSGDSPKVQVINMVKGRRVLFEHGGDAAIMPVPHLESEPKLNWSKLIEQGSSFGWLEDKRGLALDLRDSGASITEVWKELTERADFPGNKRQSLKDNPDYKYFVENVWS